MTNAILERAKFVRIENSTLTREDGREAENKRLMQLIQKLCAVIDVQAEALGAADKTIRYVLVNGLLDQSSIDVRRMNEGLDDIYVAQAKAKQILEGE